MSIPHQNAVTTAFHTAQNELDRAWVSQLLDREVIPPKARIILERHAAWLAESSAHTLGDTDIGARNKRASVRNIEAGLNSPKTKKRALVGSRAAIDAAAKEKQFIAPAWLSNPALLPRFPPGDKRNTPTPKNSEEV